MKFDSFLNELMMLSLQLPFRRWKVGLLPIYFGTSFAINVVANVWSAAWFSEKQVLSTLDVLGELLRFYRKVTQTTKSMMIYL
jgi:hypothetical protein